MQHHEQVWAKAVAGSSRQMCMVQHCGAMSGASNGIAVDTVSTTVMQAAYNKQLSGRRVIWLALLYLPISQD
jgi:hypothetical protein